MRCGCCTSLLWLLPCCALIGLPLFNRTVCYIVFLRRGALTLVPLLFPLHAPLPPAQTSASRRRATSRRSFLPTTARCWLRTRAAASRRSSAARARARSTRRCVSAHLQATLFRTLHALTTILFFPFRAPPSLSCNNNLPFSSPPMTELRKLALWRRPARAPALPDRTFPPFLHLRSAERKQRAAFLVALHVQTRELPLLLRRLRPLVAPKLFCARRRSRAMRRCPRLRRRAARAAQR